MTNSHIFSVYVLGGCGEFGRNCMLLEQDGVALAVDCGSQFPEEECFGIASIAPHPSVWENLPRPAAYILTHGHEDHIGALHHMLAHAPAPVYGTPFTLRLISERVERLPPAVRNACPLLEIQPGRSFDLPGGIPCHPVSVTHSIPQPLALVLEFPAGMVVHTGDFKLAQPPAWSQAENGDLTASLRRALRSRPVFLLATDSTGAFTPWDSPGEEVLSEPLEELLANAPGRVLVTLFSSHVERIRHFLRIGAKFGRTGAAMGRSMERYLAAAREENLLPEPNLDKLENVLQLPPQEQMLLVSGSQGETASALDRFSAGNYMSIKPDPQDTVIFSASVIPGRERSVGRVLDRFAELGVRAVWHTEESPTHVSGHGSQAELLRLFAELSPQTVIPVHGSMRYLAAARKLALQAGVPDAFVVPDGWMARWNGVAWIRTECGCDKILHLENPAETPLEEESLRQRKKIAATGVAFVSGRFCGRGGVDLRITLEGIGDPRFHPQWIREIQNRCMQDLAENGSMEPEKTVESAIKRFFKTETGKKPQVVVHWMN